MGIIFVTSVIFNREEQRGLETDTGQRCISGRDAVLPLIRVLEEKARQACKQVFWNWTGGDGTASLRAMPTGQEAAGGSYPVDLAPQLRKMAALWLFGAETHRVGDSEPGEERVSLGEAQTTCCRDLPFPSAGVRGPVSPRAIFR